MPTLPMPEERPAGPLDRTRDAMHRVSAAIGADSRVRLRILIFLAVAVVGASTAPNPWAQVTLVCLLGIALDYARAPKGKT